MGWSGPVTHRQFLTWMAWREAEWEQPGLTEWYLMQVACEVRRVLSSNPAAIQPNRFKLKFKRVDGVPRPRKTRAEAAEEAKARMGLVFGGLRKLPPRDQQ